MLARRRWRRANINPSLCVSQRDVHLRWLHELAAFYGNASLPPSHSIFTIPFSDEIPGVTHLMDSVPGDQRVPPLTCHPHKKSTLKVSISLYKILEMRQFFRIKCVNQSLWPRGNCVYYVGYPIWLKKIQLSFSQINIKQFPPNKMF